MDKILSSVGTTSLKSIFPSVYTDGSDILSRPVNDETAAPKQNIIRFFAGGKHKTAKGFTGKTFLSTEYRTARNYQGPGNNIFYLDVTRDTAIKLGLYSIVNNRPTDGFMENADKVLKPYVINNKNVAAYDKVAPIKVDKEHKVYKKDSINRTKTNDNRIKRQTDNKVISHNIEKETALNPIISRILHAIAPNVTDHLNKDKQRATSSRLTSQKIEKSTAELKDALDSITSIQRDNNIILNKQLLLVAKGNSLLEQILEKPTSESSDNSSSNNGIFKRVIIEVGIAAALIGTTFYAVNKLLGRDPSIFPTDKGLSDYAKHSPFSLDNTPDAIDPDETKQKLFDTIKGDRPEIGRQLFDEKYGTGSYDSVVKNNGKIIPNKKSEVKTESTKESSIDTKPTEITSPDIIFSSKKMKIKTRLLTINAGNIKSILGMSGKAGSNISRSIEGNENSNSSTGNITREGSPGGSIRYNDRNSPSPVFTSGSSRNISPDQSKYTKMVYDSFVSAGYSPAQAKAMTAEVGRENSMDPRYLFGSHKDKYNGFTNSGMFSWQGERSPKMLSYLREKGLLDERGNIKPTQESLNAMAAFSKQEIETNPAYAKTKNEFLSNPNISQSEASNILGHNYVGWRMDDPRYRTTGLARENQFYHATDTTNDNSNRHKILLAAGTNDWGNDPAKAAEGIRKSIAALKAKGYKDSDITLVLPNETIHGTHGAYQGATSIAKELGIKTTSPSGWQEGDNSYHMTQGAADEISKANPEAKWVGDSNAGIGQHGRGIDGQTYFKGMKSGDLAGQIERTVPNQSYDNSNSDNSNSDNSNSDNSNIKLKSPSDVLDHISEMKQKFGLSTSECVGLAMVAAGIPYGSSMPGGHTTDWRKGDSALDGEFKPGTSFATFMDRNFNPSDKYDGGHGGAPGMNKDHAFVGTGRVKYGSNGEIIAREGVEQYNKVGVFNRNHPVTKWYYNTGKGDESDLGSYSDIKAIDKHGNMDYLGGINPRPDKNEETKPTPVDNSTPVEIPMVKPVISHLLDKQQTPQQSPFTTTPVDPKHDKTRLHDINDIKSPHDSEHFDLNHFFGYLFSEKKSQPSIKVA
jgi:hypothetical protein